jgi:hypothetical protein
MVARTSDFACKHYTQISIGRTAEIGQALFGEQRTQPFDLLELSSLKRIAPGDLSPTQAKSEFLDRNESFGVHRTPSKSGGTTESAFYGDTPTAPESSFEKIA